MMSRTQIIKKNIFLDDLPKEKYGNILRIIWGKSVGYKVYFIYDDIDGYIQILSYKKKEQLLHVKYKDKEYDIATTNFSKCNIGSILGKITSDFKIEIGTHFKDDKKDIVIIDREHRIKTHGVSIVNDKWYKYHCNICGWSEGWIVESALLNLKQGCSCCTGRTTVEGINDIPTTAPWLIHYFQGGYNEAKLYTKTGSGNPNNPKGYIVPICTDCGRIKDKKMLIGDIYRRHSIGCNCSDSISFGEKIIFNILEQLDVDFQTQLTKAKFKWCDKYKYDFYFEINNEKYICEVNGIQHYEESSRGRSLKEEQLNDKLKKELALANGIKPKNYIVIDCRYSELDWIRDNNDGILNSRLAELFDLSKIYWDECLKYACCNLVKTACELKNNNYELTTTEIGKILNLSSQTIREYLKRGNGIWCNYNAKEEMIRVSIKASKENSRKVEAFHNGISLGIFNSAKEIEENSEKIFKIKLFSGGITRVCRNERKQYRGYIFKYIK